jgi:hypothetical protein
LGYNTAKEQTAVKGRPTPSTLTHTLRADAQSLCDALRLLVQVFERQATETEQAWRNAEEMHQQLSEALSEGNRDGEALQRGLHNWAVRSETGRLDNEGWRNWDDTLLDVYRALIFLNAHEPARKAVLHVELGLQAVQLSLKSASANGTVQLPRLDPPFIHRNSEADVVQGVSTYRLYLKARSMQATMLAKQYVDAHPLLLKAQTTATQFLQSLPNGEAQG